MSGLVLHGHGVSQPVRAVMWALMNKGVAYDFQKWDPLSGETRKPEFLAMNPAGTIPVLEDKENNHFLFESPAIMTYLANKHQWNDLYPSDLVTRSKVDQYMHWHHSNTRKCSGELFRPVLVGVLSGQEQATLQEAMEKGQRRVAKVTKVVETFLTKNEFIASENITIADYLCYCEYDQLEVLNIFDFSPYPHVQQWMGKMKALPHYDESHADLMKLAGFIKKKSKL